MWVFSGGLQVTTYTELVAMTSLDNELETHSGLELEVEHLPTEELLGMLLKLEIN